MPELAQHIIALTVVLACVAYAGWQAYRALRGRRSKVGSCCETGCSTSKSTPENVGKSQNDRIVYIPVDALRQRHRR